LTKTPLIYVSYFNLGGANPTKAPVATGLDELSVGVCHEIKSNSEKYLVILEMTALQLIQWKKILSHILSGNHEIKNANLPDIMLKIFAHTSKMKPLH